ncbi:MAG TPA: hypothetical protein VMX11_03570 [Actinomycetes bacterium]|nr:hypothetical protein [Actinomycetes bacterium]
MTTDPTAIVRANLTRLLASDPRTVSALARAADAHFPGRGPDAWRKAILRTIGTPTFEGTWWPVPWLAEGLAWLFHVELAALYTGRRRFRQGTCGRGRAR